MQAIDRQQLHLLLDQFLDAADLINENEQTYSQALPRLGMAMERYLELTKPLNAYMTGKIQGTFLNEVHRPDHKLDLIESKTAKGYLINKYAPYEVYTKTKKGHKTKPKLPILGDDGYLTYSKIDKVHRFIYAVFKNYDRQLPASDKNGNKLIIDHIDNNRLHYYPSNLRMLTAQQNSNNRKDQNVCSLNELTDSQLWYSHKVVCYNTHVGCKNEEHKDISSLNIYHITTDNSYWQYFGSDVLRRIKFDRYGNLQTGKGAGRSSWNMNPANLEYDEDDILLYLASDILPGTSLEDNFINIDIDVDEDEYAGLDHNDLQAIINLKMTDGVSNTDAEFTDDDFAEA